MSDEADRLRGPAEADRFERLIQEIAMEAERLEEDALYSHAGHNQEARHADRLHEYLGIPTTLLAAAAGVTSFSAAGATASFWPSVAAGVLSFGVAAMSGLTTFLDPKGRSAQHYRASIAYGVLRGEARYFHLIECKKNKPIDELDAALVEFRGRLAKLDAETPLVSADAMNRAEARTIRGDYKYAVDRGPRQEPA